LETLILREQSLAQSKQLAKRMWQDRWPKNISLGVEADGRTPRIEFPSEAAKAYTIHLLSANSQKPFNTFGLKESDMETFGQRDTVMENSMQETQVVRSLDVKEGKPSWWSIPISDPDFKLAVSTL
jgi:hypothetical protein